MLNEYSKGFLLTIGGQFFLLLVAAEYGSPFAIWFAASLAGGSFLYNSYRLINLMLVGAHRRGAAGSDCEGLFFAAGAASSPPALIVILLLSVPIFVRGPSEKMINSSAQFALQAGLERYRADVGSYPSAAQGLASLTRNPGIAAWAGPYIQATYLPFIQRFKYSVDPTGAPILVGRWLQPTGASGRTP